MKIILKELRFFAYYGHYTEERLLGAWFKVSVVLEYKSQDFFIDYNEVYAYVREMMQQPSYYLENIVQKIGEGLRARYQEIHSIWVRVEKEAPPLIAMQGRVYVEDIF